MAARNRCCCTFGYRFLDIARVMLKLHLDEGVVTKEECKEIDNLKEDFTTIQASLLSLVLCTKSQKQYKVAIKTLEGYPTVSDLTKLTLRYLSVLSKLYENGLITREDVQEMKRMKGDLKTRLVFIERGKKADTVTKTVEITERRDLNEGSKMLTVVSKLLEKNLLTKHLFSGKEIKGTWEQFVTIFVHQCPRPLEISLETAEVFQEHGMKKEAKCLRAGSKAIHQVFGKKRSTTVDVSTSTAAMKVVSAVFGVLLLHEYRHSLVARTAEDKLIVKFQNVSELCSKVLPEEMKDVEWNVVRTANPVHFDITTGLMDVGVSPQLGEKTGKLIQYYWKDRLSKVNYEILFSSPQWSNELERWTKSSQYGSSTLSSGYGSILYSEDDDLPPLAQIFKDPTPSSSGSLDLPRRDPVPDLDPESHLLEQCWIPFGIQNVHITQNGGEYLLEPPTPEHSDVNNRVFRMEVPATAISRDSLEVRYGIILDGPFALPSGYRLASPVVYVWFDHSQVTKSLKLHIPHWIAGDHSNLEESVSFVISPHVLPEGEQMYTFTATGSECTSLQDTFGTVELSGHCSLLGQAMKEEIPSCYWITPWEKEDRNQKYLRVAIAYYIPLWHTILSEYWKSWTYCGDDYTYSIFEISQESITGKLRKHSGNGWEASLNQTSINKTAVSYTSHKPEEKMEFAVTNGLYPPSFLVKIIQSCSPGCATVPAAVYLDVSGTSSGNMCFSVEVQETVSEKVPVSTSVGTQELAGLNREESVSPEQETNAFQITMRTGDIPHPPCTSAWDTSPSQHPQSVEFDSLTPSDVGLNNVVKMKPLWQDLAIELGVPVDHVQANESKPLGGLIALKYWRDGHSGQFFPSTWRFLLQKVEATFGTKVAKDLENKAILDATWSKDQ